VSGRVADASLLVTVETRSVIENSLEVATMAKTKNGSKKSDAKTDGSKKASTRNPAADATAAKKSAEKDAKKALIRAEKAVDEARSIVGSSTKKLRAKAEALSKKTAKLAAKHADAVRQLAEEATRYEQTDKATAPSPPAQGTRSTAGDQRTGPTLVELRQRAKSQRIPGYSRLNKAELVAALAATSKA
jgi:hypothetical protein